MPAGGVAVRGVSVSHSRKEDAKKRLADLKEAEAAQVAKVKAQVEPYLKRYDADGSGSLEKPEVMAMLESLAPGLQHPSEAAVDKIIQSVTGHPEVPVTVETLPQLMIMLHDFARHALFADTMMEQFDVDNSGKLDIEELLPMLKSTLAEVNASAHMSAGDVLYIFTRCDLDGDYKLSRDELVPALALWREIAPSLPVAEGQLADGMLDAAEVTRAIIEDQEKALHGEGDEEAGTTVRKLSITDNVVDQDTLMHYAVERPQPGATGGGASELHELEMTHYLEGAKVLKEGISKCVVRTRDGVKMIVTPAELKEAQRTQAKRLATKRSIDQARLATAAVMLDEGLAKGQFGSEVPPHGIVQEQSFMSLNSAPSMRRQTSSTCVVL